MLKYRKDIILWGGISITPSASIDTFYPTTELAFYNTMANKWKLTKTRISNLEGCHDATACIINRKLIITTGFQKKRIINSQDFYTNEPSTIGSSLSNTTWILDLETLNWEQPKPSGSLPVKCNKAISWSFDNTMYIFGGYGKPPSIEYQEKSIQFDIDPMFENHGWLNQFPAYNIHNNSWEWPSYTGTPPSPRAAMAHVQIEHRIFIFGGRAKEGRLNDLYELNMTSLTWSKIMMNTPYISPVGRSWHAMTNAKIKDEDHIILYGGLDNEQRALNDCWTINLKKKQPIWKRHSHLEQEGRLYHRIVCVQKYKIVIVGGITNDILAGEPTKHATQTIKFNLAPLSLKHIAMADIVNNISIQRISSDSIPYHLVEEIRKGIESA